MSAPGPAGQLGSRAARVAGELEGLGVDALLVDSPWDIRYLTGFTGSAGLVLMLAGSAGEGAGAHRFLTDFRYEAQAGEQVGTEFEREIATGELIEALARTLSKGSGRLGFDESRLSVKAHRRLGELLGGAWELVACPGAVARFRAVKEPGELESIRAACELADEALVRVLEDGLAGRTEREVALALQLEMLRLGAESESFEAIVASGSHGALPHAHPRAETIPPDALVTIDWGARFEGYCSDCTRTFATGENLPQLAREVYALVLSAQEAGISALRAGPSGRAVDAAARDVIEQGGYGERFGHGLGHGVGLEVHEAPRLARTAGDQPLAAGNVVSVEPGVYLPGVLGVRIEDLAVVGEGSPTLLTRLSKELTVIS